MSVSSIKYCHKFNLDIGAFRCQGESIDGEKFSPFSGTVLQLKFLNLDGARFVIYLKNCGNEIVSILQCNVKCYGTLVVKNDFNLYPNDVMALSNLAIQDFVKFLPTWLRPVYEKEFQCVLEIDTRCKLSLFYQHL